MRLEITPDQIIEIPEGKEINLLKVKGKSDDYCTVFNDCGIWMVKGESKAIPTEMVLFGGNVYVDGERYDGKVRTKPNEFLGAISESGKLETLIDYGGGIRRVNLKGTLDSYVPSGKTIEVSGIQIRAQLKS